MFDISPTNDWMPHMWGWGSGVMGWGMFLSALILIGIGLLFYFTFFSPQVPTSRMDEPLEIARRRFARGEITAEEFEEIRRRLRE